MIPFFKMAYGKGKADDKLMMNHTKNKFNLSRQWMLISLIWLLSCVDNPALRKRATGRTSAEQSEESIKEAEQSNTAGSSATKKKNPFQNSSITDKLIETGNAELIHLVDPRTGSFRKKVTIEKNYSGFFLHFRTQYYVSSE